jgi:cytochrome P450
MAISDDWCAHRFDHLSPELALDLHETLARMREDHPVTWSEEHGGFWVVTRYEDVLRVAQDWQAFSSAQGVSVPETGKMVVPAIPEHLDPPLHRTYKRLINAHFTPAVVGTYEAPTRELGTRLIDEFIEAGSCDFMADFARPFPGLAFFDLVLGAPPDEVAEVNRLATTASVSTHPGARDAWRSMFQWITDFVADRRRRPARGDVVDAVLAAEIEGRPITDDEIIGVVQLLILGGLDTTAGALGQIMIRFTREPDIPELLRARPDLMGAAVEELLRLEPPFIAIARTATCDTEVGGQAVRKGDKVLIYWASANRDEAEFACPAHFDLGRPSNRHLAFGAGPHRCAGSNLARLNVRVALEELVGRLDDVRLQEGVEPLPFHSALNRAPLSVPITFTPGVRALAVSG